MYKKKPFFKKGTRFNCPKEERETRVRAFFLPLAAFTTTRHSRHNSYSDAILSSKADSKKLC